MSYKDMKQILDANPNIATIGELALYVNRIKTKETKCSR